ncbi:hypothetical protein [Leisingera sp.]|uniref:hypothetical protein n=1 Tax=Leisingera sp. TaxID=1879318 RepID=UPI002B278240|nr:hypothetical protein [Leisingera sp.]
MKRLALGCLSFPAPCPALQLIVLFTATRAPLGVLKPVSMMFIAISIIFLKDAGSQSALPGWHPGEGLNNH